MRHHVKPTHPPPSQKKLGVEEAHPGNWIKQNWQRGGGGHTKVKIKRNRRKRKKILCMVSRRLVSNPNKLKNTSIHTACVCSGVFDCRRVRFSYNVFNSQKRASENRAIQVNSGSSIARAYSFRSASLSRMFGEMTLLIQSKLLYCVNCCYDRARSVRWCLYVTNFFSTRVPRREKICAAHYHC